jgi:hypothetical protein
MLNRAHVAEAYARERGLDYHPQARLRYPPSLRLPATRTGTWPCWAAIVGPVAGGRPGILYIYDKGTPSAQFELPGLERVIDGLCVRRSGHNLLTRQALPKGYAELSVDDGEFSARYRVGVRSADHAETALRLLDPAFRQWLVYSGPQGSSSSAAGTIDIVGGVLFLMGDYHAFQGPQELDAFATSAGALADRVAAWAPPG